MINNSVCTSYEQSKSLLELGLDPNTADMKYDPRWDIPVIISEYDYDNRLNYNPEHEITDIPAWSLSALLNVLPKYYSKENHQFCQSYKYDWIDGFYHFIYYDYQHGGRDNTISKSKNILDAAYEMVVYFLKKKLI